MGRLAAYVAGEVGCRNYPRRRLAPSARDRAGVGYSASILQVPLSPIPPRGLSASRLQTGTTVGFEGFEGGEPGARSQRLALNQWGLWLGDRLSRTPPCLQCIVPLRKEEDCTMNTTHLTAEPLNVGATEIGARRLGQVHILQTKSLTTKPPELGREPPPDPGVHRLKAAPSRRPRKRASPRIGLIQTVLRQGVPEWNDRFPSVEEMPNERLQIKGKKALGKDPRTCGPEWEWNKIRKSFMRAVGREKRK